MRPGRWQQTVGTYLYGRTLALLGLGHIGSAVAGVGRAFGMKTVAWSPHLTEERANQGGATLVSKEDLFRRADVLSIHLVLSEGTRGIVGERELSLMRSHRAARRHLTGTLVSEAALIDALRAGRIAGAGLDVFDPEPYSPDDPLCSMDNVGYPHLGYVTDRTYACPSSPDRRGRQRLPGRSADPGPRPVAGGRASTHATTRVRRPALRGPQAVPGLGDGGQGVGGQRAGRVEHEGLAVRGRVAGPAPGLGNLRCPVSAEGAPCMQVLAGELAGVRPSGAGTCASRTVRGCRR